MLDSSNMNNGSGLIRDGVYSRIRTDILTCGLAPGSRVFENDLAERYGVSKSPVRDALLRLQEHGLVEVLPRKGYLIRPISLADAKDLYEMRLLLEKSCIRRACDFAIDDELAALDRFRAADHDDSLAEWVSYNRNFHRAIAVCSGNARMAKMSEEVIDQFDRLTFMGVSNLRADMVFDKLVEEHCEIIDALQARGRSKVTCLITRHIKKSQKRLFTVLENPPIVE